MPGMELFSKSTQAKKKPKTSQVFEAKPVHCAETLPQRDFSLDTLDGSEGTERPVSETVPGAQVASFNLDSIKGLLNQSIRDIEDMSGIEMQPTVPKVTVPDSAALNENEELGHVEEVSLEELLGIKLEVNERPPATSQTLEENKPVQEPTEVTVVDTAEESPTVPVTTDADSTDVSSLVQEGPIPVVPTESTAEPQEDRVAEPPKEAEAQTSSVEVDSEVNEVTAKPKEAPIKEFSESSTVSIESGPVEEPEPFSVLDVIEVSDEEEAVTPKEGEVEQADTEEPPNDDVEEEPVQEATEEPTEEVTEQATTVLEEEEAVPSVEEDTQATDSEQPAEDASRIAFLENEVAQLRESVTQLTEQLRTATVIKAAEEIVTEDTPASESVPMKEEEVPVKEQEEITFEVEDTEGYYPFIEETRETFQKSFANMKLLQRLLDLAVPRTERKGALSIARSVVFGSSPKTARDYTEKALGYNTFSDVDKAVQTELDMYPTDTLDALDIEDAVDGEYNMASAFFGVWMLRAIDPVSGCTDIDFGVDEEDTQGNVIVIFDDFYSVYAGFKDEEAAQNFCLFMKSFVACHVSEVTTEERSNSYHPFKQGMRGQALSLLDFAQVYQASEDYKSEPHGLNAVFAFFRGPGMNDMEMLGGQYGGAYGSQYGSQYSGQYGSQYGSQYGGSYSQYNSQYSMGVSAGMGGSFSRFSRGSLLGYNRNNMAGRSPYGSTAYGRQDEMGRPRGLARFFGPKVDRYGRPKKSLKRRFDDMIELGLENRISRCTEIDALDRIVRSLDRRVKQGVRRKITSGRWYADYHVMGLGALSAYKTLQMTLDKSSGVRDILVGQVDGGRGGPTVIFIDFCELRLTFTTPTAADAFVDYISDQFNVERIM